MPKKKRIWYPGAMFHVMSRGNRRTAIFKEDSDYVDFLEYLGKVKETFGKREKFVVIRHIFVVVRNILF